MTHRDIAAFNLAVYGQEPNGPEPRQETELTWAMTPRTISTVSVGVVMSEGTSIVVFEGTHDTLDILIDLEAVATKTAVGHVHSGMWTGMEDCWSDISPYLTRDWIATGHSLGAGHALLFAAIAKLAARPPLECVTFGSPPLGYSDFAEWLSDVKITNYRNNGLNFTDPVTEAHMPLEPFVPAAPWTDVCRPPDELDDWGPFAPHRMQYYAEVCPNTAVLPPDSTEKTK